MGALNDDLLGFYRDAVDKHLETQGAMSDGVLTEEDVEALVGEQTRACADVGLRAVKRSDLVKEILGQTTSAGAKPHQASNHSNTSNGVKIEKKRSWRELSDDASQT